MFFRQLVHQRVSVIGGFHSQWAGKEENLSMSSWWNYPNYDNKVPMLLVGIFCKKQIILWLSLHSARKAIRCHLSTFSMHILLIQLFLMKSTNDRSRRMISRSCHVILTLENLSQMRMCVVKNSTVCSTACSYKYRITNSLWGGSIGDVSMS